MSGCYFPCNLRWFGFTRSLLPIFFSPLYNLSAFGFLSGTILKLLESLVFKWLAILQISVIFCYMTLLLKIIKGHPMPALAWTPEPSLAFLPAPVHPSAPPQPQCRTQHRGTSFLRNFVLFLLMTSSLLGASPSLYLCCLLGISNCLFLPCTYLGSSFLMSTHNNSNSK